MVVSHVDVVLPMTLVELEVERAGVPSFVGAPSPHPTRLHSRRSSPQPTTKIYISMNSGIFWIS